MILVFNNYKRYSTLSGFDGNPSRVWLSANGGVTPVVASGVPHYKHRRGMVRSRHRLIYVGCFMVAFFLGGNVATFDKLKNSLLKQTKPVKDADALAAIIGKKKIGVPVSK